MASPRSEFLGAELQKHSPPMIKTLTCLSAQVELVDVSSCLWVLTFLS